MRNWFSKYLTETGKAGYGQFTGNKEEIFLKIPFPSGNPLWRCKRFLVENHRAAINFRGIPILAARQEFCDK